ncbi:ergosterol biosynthesis protein-like protein [Elsinoe ampelina]|uniref:Ergosterol biosynthesis protein-like protein n=1 Tax=Elsinoe ampelina TaxID=302913 RepID=A0A6A6GDU5_9PEZI|nr:ergosterol biosynthesis protein-like protein [Elsinoe ampelina]
MSALLTSFLPQVEGLLPKWIFLVGTISLLNSIQAYASLSATRPVTPLSARTFGTWTFITGIVRIYAAHRLNEPAWFEIAAWTFAVAWGHFVSEWLVFRSVRLNAGSAGPFGVATGSLVWMFLQRGFYLK